MQKMTRHWRLVSLTTLLFGAMWIAASATAPGSTVSGAAPAPRPGFSAPNFALDDAGGGQLELSDLRGIFSESA